MIFIILSSLVSPPTNEIFLYLLAAAAIPLTTHSFIKKIERNFFITLFFKKSSKRGLQSTKGGRILFGLLLSVGTGGLMGLLFGWSIGLWVAAGLGVIMLIYFLSGEKTPTTKHLTPRELRNIERRNEIERKRRQGINY